MSDSFSCCNNTGSQIPSSALEDKGIKVIKEIRNWENKRKFTFLIAEYLMAVPKIDILNVRC